MHDVHFPSIAKLDTAILYLFELLSSLAIVLLAFGLIASMANVLTEGSVLSDNLIMQRIWAWTQCVAIDASVAGTILRTFQYYDRRERVKTVLSALLSALLLFTAAIVSNIEALQQTLNVALSMAYAHVFVPVEALIWIRSLSIVLLIVAHALRHVRPEQVASYERTVVVPERPPHPVRPQQGVPQANGGSMPEQTAAVASEENALLALSAPAGDQGEQDGGDREHTSGANRSPEMTLPEANTNYQRIKAYRHKHPHASLREIARALSLSTSTVSRWLKQLRADASSTQER